jgi:hypothetical protein
MSDQIDGEDNTDSGEAVGTNNDARLKMYAEISDNFEDIRQKTEDVAQVGEDLDEDVEQVNQQHAEPVVEQVAPTKVKLKINGQEREMTFEEVIATAQKVASADEYLRQSKETFQNLVVKPQPSQDAGEVVEDDALDLARKLQMGSEEEAAEVIRSLAKRQLSIQPDVIARQVEDNLRFKQAGDWAKTEYQDIFADEDLRTLFLQKDQMLVQNLDQRDYRDRYKAIGDEIRTKFKLSTHAKQERKSATIVNLPTASRKAEPTIVEESEESPSDIIRNMARTRPGQNYGG